MIAWTYYSRTGGVDENKVAKDKNFSCWKKQRAVARKNLPFNETREFSAFSQVTHVSFLTCYF